RIDVVFVPDADNYSGPADPNFLANVSTLIQQAYFAQGDATPSNAAMLLTNQDTFNFWLAGGGGMRILAVTPAPPRPDRPAGTSLSSSTPSPTLEPSCTPTSN